jgi:hypothetical protein
MMEISTERFAELIVAEHNYRKLCRIIKERANNYDKLDNAELKILKEILCPRDVMEMGSEEFKCL